MSRRFYNDIAFFGIAHDGHYFGVPLDGNYGKCYLLKKDEYPKDDHCVNMCDALLNWNFKEETEYLQKLGLRTTLKEGHYLFTAPVFLAMYANRRTLCEAITLHGGSPINFEEDIWIAQRSGIFNAWKFNGEYKSFNSYCEYALNQIGTVMLWNPPVKS